MIVQSLIIILSAYLLVFYIKKLTTAFLDKFKILKDDKHNQRLDTLKPLFNNTITVIIYSVAGLMILNNFGFNISPILTGAGLVGLTFSLGSRSLIKDVIYGVFIIIENTYNVGDEIEAGGFKGKVIELKLRNTILKDSDGNKIYLSNSETQKVKVMKKK